MGQQRDRGTPSKAPAAPERPAALEPPCGAVSAESRLVSDLTVWNGWDKCDYDLALESIMLEAG